MYGNISVILFIQFLIYAAWLWLLCAVETCSCYWNYYDKSRVSMEYVHIIACSTITRGISRLKKEVTCLWKIYYYI